MNMIKICEYLEKFCAWSYDNGIIYFSGRDVYCILTGFLSAFVVYALIYLLLGKDKDE